MDHQLAAGPAFEVRGLVFTNETGGPLHPNILAIRFRKLIAAVDQLDAAIEDAADVSA